MKNSQLTNTNESFNGQFNAHADRYLMLMLQLDLFKFRNPAVESEPTAAVLNGAQVNKINAA
jgi:hypothetical protein